MNTFNELMYQIDGEETFESSLYNSLFTDNYYIEKEDNTKRDLTPKQQLEELEKRNKRLKKIIIAAIAICGAIIAALIIINKKKSKEIKNKELENEDLRKKNAEWILDYKDACDRQLSAEDNARVTNAKFKLTNIKLKKSQEEADDLKAEISKLRQKISELKQKSADTAADKNKTPEEKKEEKEKYSQEMKDTTAKLVSALSNVKKLQESKERVKKHEDEVRRDLEQKKYELKNKNRKQRPNTVNAWGEKYSGTIKKEKKRFNAYLSQIKSADATITTLKAKLAECEKIKDETERISKEKELKKQIIRTETGIKNIQRSMRGSFGSMINTASIMVTKCNNTKFLTQLVALLKQCHEDIGLDNNDLKSFINTNLRDSNNDSVTKLINL
jgi:DNA repair exonuclease SbcCD ATPase subunit